VSFSSDVKGELCRLPLSDREEVLAEAYGVLLFCNQFTRSGVRITTLSPAFARRLPELFRCAFALDFDVRPDDAQTGKRSFALNRPDAIARILDAFGSDAESHTVHHINYAVLEGERSHAAFCRGAFLAGGSVTDPAKGYHLELTTNHLHVHRELQALIPELGLQPRSTTRKSNYITYFKRSTSISAFLTAIGAPESARAIAEARASKSLLNSVNRQYNCDVANVDKAVAAAQAQIDAIRQLEQRGTLSGLSDSLRETARLRRDNPELSLAQLAAMMNPPVSKSCLNHRLRRLLELAGERSAVQ
jgi:DNA-binding protein WhiA